MGYLFDDAFSGCGPFVPRTLFQFGVACVPAGLEVRVRVDTTRAAEHDDAWFEGGWLDDGGVPIALLSLILTPTFGSLL